MSKRQSSLLDQVISSQWFALADLLLVVGSGLFWIFKPEIGVLPIIFIALIPWIVRILAGSISFRGTLFDWLIVIFLVTAWVGYWAAYDRETAWSKVWLIVLAVLLYYALSTQPEENLSWICAFLFFIGLGASIYFFLTYDFPGRFGKIALWWLNNRPKVGWSTIHHGYIAGVLFITNLFTSYWLWNIRGKSLGRFSTLVMVLIFLGWGITLGVFMLTITRGILASVVGILGVWLLWKISTSNKFQLGAWIRSLFPILVLVYLSVIITFIYLVPVQAVGAASQSDYGKNTRGELFGRSAYFLADYPITGGGLSSFPGLYSQYILVIPSFYFINSYNLFLDVSIEQGLLGGLILVIMYVGGIWFSSRTIENARSHQVRFFGWMALFAIIFTILYSLFYDYLYNGYGAMLLLLPVGISRVGVKYIDTGDRNLQFPRQLSWWKQSNFQMLFISIVFIVVALAFNFNKVRSIWFSNLGAVQMSKVELMNFPTNQWAGMEILPDLETADVSLHSALQYDPGNITANYRLGIIAMLRRDFDAAVHYLEIAYRQSPNHRGIIKTLGYCYVWLGEVNKAQLLLTKIPEARNELGVYSWWWNTQSRTDLANKALIMVSKLETLSSSK